jgi:hypothetical protein
MQEVAFPDDQPVHHHCHTPHLGWLLGIVTHWWPTKVICVNFGLIQMVESSYEINWIVFLLIVPANWNSTLMHPNYVIYIVELRTMMEIW